MVRKFLLLGLLLVKALLVQAQTKGSLHGTVRSESGQALSNVYLEIKSLQLTATSNETGDFSFNKLDAGEYVLTASHLGYEFNEQKVSITANKTTTIRIKGKDKTQQLDQITVTAEKRENTLQKVAMSVSALSSRQLQERKINEMSDFLMSVPNLMSMNLGSPTLNMISIRGVNTFSTDPVVGIYVDGIPMFDGYSSSMQIQNIERVEILRGPQSTLYGRNALGGVMNIITAKPGNVTHGFAQVGLGNYNQQRYSAGISGALIKNKLFAGISGLYDTRKGFFENLATGKDFDNPKTSGGNVYLKYLPNEKLSFTLTSRGEYNNVTGTFPYVYASTARETPYTVNQNGANIEKRTLISSSLLVSYKLKSAELSSISGHTHMNDTYKGYDVDYSPYDVLTFVIPSQPQNTYTQEFKFVTDNDRRLKFTGGLFGFIDHKNTHTIYEYGSDGVTYYPNAPYSSDIFADKKVYGIAAYAHATYSITDKLDITAGLRYDYEKRTLTHSTTYTKAPADPMVIAPETTIKGNNDAFSPKIGLSYKASEDVLLYANYARGYRSGGFNQYTAQANKLNYKPEFTGNYELGAKSEWLNHRLRANLAFFYINWKDQQQAVAFPDMVTDNVGELTNKGVELELTALPVRGLEIHFNLGMVDTEYKHLLLANETGDGTVKDYVGNKQIFTPSFSSSLSATYRRSFGKDYSFYVTPEWKYLGKQYLNYYNDLVQDAFSLVNASAGIRKGGVELSVWAKNIGDAHYLAFAYATNTGAQSPVGQGIPRLFGAALKYSF